MDRLLSIEAFVRVAETGNFARAAQQLGVTRSVVTHRIQQLEAFINTPLSGISQGLPTPLGAARQPQNDD
ncbi:LysR family transcriptional regulator [Pseudomonas guariconensis]|nr:LysR family transcriptional regulator [Pseudomonas putida]MCO7566765.1 LysR family transcriptional regulator [Pseudomonas mosselii]MCO7596791.1 LysR family transcriptional regulator [Pseudomonas guariconensis]MCO7641641.1 LysR family transcriptional regulator [Pseudomonas sp. S 311-6]MCU7222831.1 LysR family transcriptional regulator [Pseudomonas brassicacearum]